jgi:NitT/TauT family transport system ATP-binding protein
MQKDFITIDQVSFSYEDKEVLSNVQLKLEQGSSYAMIGKSGSGKTTLLNLIAGFLKPHRGSIIVDGHAIEKPRKKTAFLFQELGLFQWQTVSEAVSMPLKLHGQKERQSEVVGLLNDMGILELKDKYPHELSGGERQRVALARTLISAPDLLLMDEPTSALDAMTKEELQTLILREQRRRSSTMVFVTHDIEEALMLGTNILVLEDNGTVSQWDNPYYFIENPREQLDFYQECIRFRKLLKVGSEQ